MSTKPGATTAPSASISRAPRPPTRPTSVIRPPVIAMSAVRRGPPVPSTTVPPRITTSCSGMGRTFQVQYTDTAKLAGERLRRVVPDHARALGAELHVHAQVAPVEQPHELLVVGADRGIGQHEPLELRVPLLPGLRSALEQCVQVVEVGLGERVADLIRPLQVPRGAEGQPELVP